MKRKTNSTHEATARKVQQSEGMVLADPQDREAFVEALLQPPAASHRLKAAAWRYRSITVG
jgi:uncharacterized protein (DUF1778 family)